MKTAIFVATVLTALAPGRLHAQEPDASSTEQTALTSSRWEIDARASYVVLGSNHPTGGIMPSLAARRAWIVGHGLSLSLGADVGAFGFSGPTHWIGFVAGPTAGATWKPTTASFAASAAVRADMGRVPTCNAWNMCVNSWGLFPAGDLEVSYYTSAHVAFGAALTVRYVTTVPWAGADWEPTAVVRTFF